ncbi:MAG: beta-galactosidase [Armatimonadota bacterium]
MAPVIPLAWLLLAPTSDGLEIVRATPDGVGFQLGESGDPFVLFGSNAVVHTGNPDDPWALNLLTPAGWDHGLLTTMLDRARDLGMNHIKFFLPIGQVLPDPQPTDGARLVDGTEERVRILLDEAAARGLRVSLTLTSWGGNGCQWWQEGGQYWGTLGRMLPRDSFVTLADFWRQMAALCRDRGALLSYNLAVEWTLPNGNLTWEPEPKGLIPGIHALPAFRHYVTLLYQGDIDALNAAWGTTLESFNDVTLPDLAWDGQAYASPDGMVRDYNEFREWTSLRYLRSQAEAIRSVDPDHMVTAGAHGRTPADQWPGSAQYVMGFTSRDAAGFLDYVTVHHYVQANRVEEGLALAELLARFAWNGVPVVMEEYGYAPDPEDEDAESTTASVMIDLMRRTQDDVAGWSAWYLTNAVGQTAIDVDGVTHFGPYTPAWQRTELGERMADLVSEGFFAGPSRRVAAENVVSVDRASCMAPRELGVLLRIARDWDAYVHPIDFEYPPPPMD